MYFWPPHDVARFCTVPFEHCVLTLDPTFCLEFSDVTPSTYRHLLVECRRTGRPPVMIGPTLIHYRKTFASYLYFASSMIAQCKEIEQLRVFGTDGEKALIDAFLHGFPFAVHLTCFIHVHRNLKDELAKRSFPCDLKATIIDDIFGKKVGTTLYEGLVDVNSETEFDDKLEQLLSKWVKQFNMKEEVEEFSKWFMENKANTMKHSMLRPVREEAGLGSPAEAFYTNASESINSVIKAKVQYKRNELSHFISKLNELAEEQEREVEKAVIGRGKYCLRAEYRHLEISEKKWFSMTCEQRVKHLKKVAATSVSDIGDMQRSLLLLPTPV